MDTGLPAFEELQNLLSTMQLELTQRNWIGDLYDRADRALELRLEMWKLIDAYTKESAR